MLLTIILSLSILLNTVARCQSMSSTTTELNTEPAIYAPSSLPETFRETFCSFLATNCPYLRSEYAIPFINNNDRVNLVVDFIIQHFESMNDQKQSFVIKADVQIMWKLPPCAVWENVATFNNETIDRIWKKHSAVLKRCHFSKDSIYHPLMLHLNSIRDTYSFANSGNPKIRVESDGIARLVNRNLLDSSCSLNFEHFPFDKQQCALELTAFSQDDNITLAYWNYSHETKNFMGDSVVWELESVSTSTYYTPHFSVAKLSFVFRRKPTYYLIVMISPNILLSFLMLATFLIPVDLPDRGAYAVAVFLAFAVTFTNFTSYMPITSQQIRIVYYAILNAIASAVITIYALLATKIHCYLDGKTARKNKCMDVATFAKLDKIVFAVCVLAIIFLNIAYFTDVAITTA